jgi:hypothetical protein
MLLKIQKASLWNVLIFILGLFATFQLVEVGGVTVFSWLLFLFALRNFLNGKFRIKEKMVFYLIASMFVTEVINLFILDSKLIKWQTSSWKSFAIYIALFFTFDYLITADNRRINIFFRGLYWSCLIQLFWCYAQLVLNTISGINLNKLIFVQILSIWPEESFKTMGQGQFLITGLHSNAGILTPVLLMGLFVFKNIYFKILTIILFFISGSSTMVISGSVYILLWLILSLRHKKLVRHFKISVKTVLFFGIAVLFVGLLISTGREIITRVDQVFTYFTKRMVMIGGTYSIDGSTYAHMRYYTSIPYILGNSSLLTTLLGYGLLCAGLPFVEFFGQYSFGGVWVPESDPITYLYNIGIVGFAIFYTLIFSIIIKGYKVDYRYTFFVLNLAIGGIFYGMQLRWVVLIEWIFLISIRKGKTFDELIGDIPNE